MTDLRKTQPEWTRFLGRELGFYLACLAELRELEARYTRQRTRLVVLGDVHGNAPRVELQGVDLGVNTSIDGVLVVHVVGQADPRTVRLFRGPGAGAADLVAEGQGAAASTIALGERNQSGLRGTWRLPPKSVEDVSGHLRLLPVPDWAARLRRVWDGSVEEDARSADEALAALAAVAARLADARAVVREALVAFATRSGGRGEGFLGASHAALVSDSAFRDGSGAVGRRRAGFLPALARAMAEETLAGPQAVVGRVVRARPAVFAPSNDGQGRVLAHVPREHCPAARWVFTCVRGKDTGHGGREEFDGVAKVVGQERQLRLGGLRVKQSFAGPDGLGPFVLERVCTKQGDPQDEVLGPADVVAVAGERDGNTDGGLLFWRTEKGPSGWDVSLFRSANRALGDLVARAEGAAPAAPFQASERAASGLSVAWRLGPQPRPAEGALDLNFFVVENAAGLADSFELTTEVESEGRYQRLVADELGAALHGRPAGQETVGDGWVQAGLWPPLSEEGP